MQELFTGDGKEVWESGPTYGFPQRKAPTQTDERLHSLFQVDGITGGDHGSFLVVAQGVVHTAGVMGMGPGVFFVGPGGGRLVAVAETISIQQRLHLLHFGVGGVVDILYLGDGIKVMVLVGGPDVDQLGLAVGDHIGALIAAAMLGVDILTLVLRKEVHTVKLVLVILDAGVAEDGRGNVHQRAGLVADFMALVGIVDDKGDAAGGIHHGTLADGVIVADHVAVVAGKEDKSVLVHPLVLQRLNNAAHLIIHKGHAGIVEILGPKDILPAHLQPLTATAVTDHVPELVQFFLFHLDGGGRVLAVELLPGGRGAVRRMGMNKRGHEEHGALRVTIVDVLHTPVTDPRSGVVLGWKLGDLGLVVHLAAHAVVVDDPRVVFHDEFGVIVLRLRQFFLAPALFKAQRAVRVGQIMQLAHGAALVAGPGEPGIEALALIGIFGIIVIAAGAGGILAGKHGKPGRHAHGRGGGAAVKGDGILHQGVQIGGLDSRVSVGGDHIPALLVGKENQDMFQGGFTPFFERHF